MSNLEWKNLQTETCTGKLIVMWAWLFPAKSWETSDSVSKFRNRKWKVRQQLRWLCEAKFIHQLCKFPYLFPRLKIIPKKKKKEWSARGWLPYLVSRVGVIHQNLRVILPQIERWARRRLPAYSFSLSEDSQ